SADMSKYYIANYDNNSKIVKLWAPYGELGRAATGEIDVKNIYLSVTAQGNRIEVSINGRTLISVSDENVNAQREGLFGLNVCATRATFYSVGLQRETYEYDASGDFTAKSAADLSAYAVYNVTDGNVKIPAAFCEINGRRITVKSGYFTFLTAGKEYEFRVKGSVADYSFKVAVRSVPAVTLTPLAVQCGANASFFVGGIAVEEVKVNGATLDKGKYRVQNGTLTIDASAFVPGENAVNVSPLGFATVTVEELPGQTLPEEEEKGCNSSLSAAGSIAVISAVAALFVAGGKIRSERRKKNVYHD
ncbi:MAG: hemoblobin-interacting domain-containing protein, partial [Candidatus Scatosoma sp.]